MKKTPKVMQSIHNLWEILTFLYLCGYVHLSIVPWEAPRLTFPNRSSRWISSWNQGEPAELNTFVLWVILPIHLKNSHRNPPFYLRGKPFMPWVQRDTDLSLPWWMADLLCYHCNHIPPLWLPLVYLLWGHREAGYGAAECLPGGPWSSWKPSA